MVNEIIGWRFIISPNVGEPPIRHFQAAFGERLGSLKRQTVGGATRLLILRTLGSLKTEQPMERQRLVAKWWMK